LENFHLTKVLVWLHVEKYEHKLMLVAKLNRKNIHASFTSIDFGSTSIVKWSEETYRFRTITSLQNHNVNHSITKT